MIPEKTLEKILEMTKATTAATTRKNLIRTHLSPRNLWTDRKVTCNLMDDLTGEELISNYPTHQQGILQPYEARVIFSVKE